MKFEKLANDQHQFIEFLYQQKDEWTYHNQLPKSVPTLTNETLMFLGREKLIELWWVGMSDCRYRIAPKGKTYYENYLQDQSDSKSAKKQSRIAIVISIIALAVAVAEFIRSFWN